MKRLELLAPARDYASAVAAVDAGADAIYIGGARFGARHAAANSVDDIRRAAEYAHLYGVRVHATLNTLLYDDELAAAERQARELVAAGVDALIVQDAARRTARLDADGDPHACRGGVSGECGFRTRDSGTGAVARRDPCDLPRHDSRG